MLELDTGVNTAPVVPDIHPRILERMKLAALAKKRAVILAQLDQLIDSLGRMSPLIGRFSVQADTTWKLRDQLASVEPANPASLVLLDRIKQHMVNLASDFTAFDPKTEFDRQS